MNIKQEKEGVAKLQQLTVEEGERLKGEYDCKLQILIYVWQNAESSIACHVLQFVLLYMQ
jgi:hypothetical protein